MKGWTFIIIYTGMKVLEILKLFNFVGVLELLVNNKMLMLLTDELLYV